MSEKPKENTIETQSKTFRLAVDVIELLERWAVETGQSPTHVLQTCVRTAFEDEKCLARADFEGESAIQDGEAGVNVLQIRTPQDRDSLADAITLLLGSVKLGERDRISALGVARARIYKGTVEYQAAKAMRAKGGRESLYENEAALADDLSNGRQSAARVR